MVEEEKYILKFGDKLVEFGCVEMHKYKPITAEVKGGLFSGAKVEFSLAKKYESGVNMEENSAILDFCGKRVALSAEDVMTEFGVLTAFSKLFVRNILDKQQHSRQPILGVEAEFELYEWSKNGLNEVVTNRVFKDGAIRVLCTLKKNSMHFEKRAYRDAIEAIDNFGGSQNTQIKPEGKTRN